MFLFSIMPIPIDGGNQNYKPINEIDGIENTIKLLESYLTSKALGYDFDADPNTAGIQELEIPGIDINNLSMVEEEVKKRREEEIKLIEKSGYVYDSSPVSSNERWYDIKNKLVVAEQRLGDLNGLKNALMSGSGTPYDADPNTHGIQVVSGLNTPQNPHGTNDINVVNEKIKQTEAYEKVLKDAEGFWKKISEAESQTLANHSGAVTKEEMFNGYKEEIGFVGLDRIIKLHGNLDALIQGRDYDSDPNTPGTQVLPGLNTPENPFGAKDANVVRKQLQITQSYFLAQLPKAKNESWFNELKSIALKREAEISKLALDAVKRAQNLEKLLYSLINGTKFNGVIDGLNTPQNPNGAKDANVVRQELYRTRALVGEYFNEKEFLSKVTGNEGGFKNISNYAKQESKKLEQNLKKVANELKKTTNLLEKLMKNPGNNDKQITSLREKVYRLQASENELRTEKEFLDALSLQI